MLKLKKVDAKKEELRKILNDLKILKKQSLELEQHQTNYKIASDALDIINDDINLKGKKVADLGCGSGVFGIGCLMLGADKVFFVDVDNEALSIAMENKNIVEKKLNKKLNAVFLNQEIKDFKTKVDVIVQNPPLLSEKSHLDKLFLLRAMELSNRIYSFHKIESSDFVTSFSKENDFNARLLGTFKVSLLKKGLFIKGIKHVDTGFWKIERFKK